MGEQCPACGQEAQATVSVGMGDTWKGVMGKPPHSLLTTYQMIHVGGTTRDGDLKLFLHGQDRHQV